MTDERADWLQREPGVIQMLEWTIGADDCRRLAELMSEAGGLSPTEARAWFEHDARTWRRVERLVAVGLLLSVHDRLPIPHHLDRWLDGPAVDQEEVNRIRQRATDPTACHRDGAGSRLPPERHGPAGREPW